MITSLINPANLSSAQDSLWHIATSNNSGQTDFKYVFDVFKGSQQLIRVKLFPDIDTGKGYFDASSVIKNEFTFDWFTPVSDTNDIVLANPEDKEIYVTYNVRVGEDFSGVTTLNMASGITSAFNYTPSVFKRRQSDIHSFDNNFLTNRPKKTKASRTDKIMIPYIQQDIGNYIYVTVYGENNTILNSDNIEIVNFSEYTQLDIGVEAINTTFGYELFDDNTAYYKVEIYNTNNDVYSDSFYVYLDCNPLYTTFNLFFINQYGMFDTARFSKASRLNMNTERKAYQRKEYDFKTSSVEYYDANNVYKESKINYGSKSNWTYKLTMDFPTDEEYQWLSEIITSPQIYAEIDGDYYPVTITATNYEYSKYQNNGLRVFEVEIELNQTRNGFRR